MTPPAAVLAETAALAVGFGPTGGGEEPVAISASFAPATDEQAAMLRIDAKLRPDWHVYSITQPPGGPKRTTIKLADSSDYKVRGEFKSLNPPVSRIDDGAWQGLEIQEHADEVTWFVPLDVAEGTDPTKLEVKGTVSLLACNESCMAMSLPFVASYDAKAAEGLPKVDRQVRAASQAKIAAKGPLAEAMADIPLIPRETLFGDPPLDKFRMLSPDGKWLTLIKPIDGVMNIWVAPADKIEEAKPVTRDKHRPIVGHSWSFDSKKILYVQDKGGDENFHVYAANIETDETKDLTPGERIKAQILGASEKFPNELLVGINERNPQLHDVYRVDIGTGERKLVQENTGFLGFVADDDFRVKLAIAMTPDGGQKWLQPKGEPAENGYSDWNTIEEFTVEDAMTSSLAGIDKESQLLFYQDSRDRNTSALYSRSFDTGKRTVIAEDPRTDVVGAITHPRNKRIQAVWFCYRKQEWKILDPSIHGDIEYLQQFHDGEFLITSRTLDDSQWTVVYVQDDGPAKFYRYERPLSKDEQEALASEAAKAAAKAKSERQDDGKEAPKSPLAEPKLYAKRAMHFLLDTREDLDGFKLTKMHAPEIKSRDGLELISFLSLPPGSDSDGDGVPDKPVPMVLDVHGGPWVREAWGFNANHQWLANRGYAVLTVNFRGSTGFGKEFINAGNRQWGAKMHDDLLDAVQWAIDAGVAQPDKIAIMGGSYGGYATLVGLSFTPKVFACGVDIVGPSSLVTLMENSPPYWIPLMPAMKIRMGDWTTEEGRQDLLARSPITHVDKIERPLLIGQGANDPRVPQQEADQIVAAMKEKGIPVTYALYPDEGHGFGRAENRKSFNAITEAFLAKHLGGRYEPIGDALEGASLQVPSGIDGIPDLAAAMKKK